MPDVTALDSADLIFLLKLLRNMGNALEKAFQLLTCFAAGNIVRIACNHNTLLAAAAYFFRQQPACAISVVPAPVRRIYMIAYMTIIIYTAAFPVPVADLSYLMRIVMYGDPPYLFMSESEPRIRRRNMQGDQINFTV